MSTATNTWPSYGGGDGPTGRPGPAKIIPFPMRARVGMLDRMAISISTVRDAGKRQAYRDRFEQQKRQSMLTRGLSTDVVESEMAIYNRELDWRLAAMGCA